MFDNRKINKNRRAVAVKYNKSQVAPKVIAQGSGYVAHKIIEKAESENITVVEDEKLTEDLMNISIGEYIPPELYEAVAQILIFITDLDKHGR